MKLLSEATLLADPLGVFSAWYEDAKACGDINIPEAMCLSTICSDGYPQGRVVLLKDFSPEGFVFYTNTRSVKGLALGFAPRAAMTFYWMPQDRQVRLQGDVVPVRDADADIYFASRPRASQLSAWASNQSEVLESREYLEKRMREVESEYEGCDVPRPSYWSGYRLLPHMIEFWQNRDDRLHDRFRYAKTRDGVWKVERLYP